MKRSGIVVAGLLALGIRRHATGRRDRRPGRRLDDAVRRVQPRQLQPDRRRQLGARGRSRAGRQRQWIPGHAGVVRRLRAHAGVLGRRAGQQRHLHPLRRSGERQRSQLVRGQHLRHARRSNLPHRRHRAHRLAGERRHDRRAVEQLRDQGRRPAAGRHAERHADGRHRAHAVRRRPDRPAVRAPAPSSSGTSASGLSGCSHESPVGNGWCGGGAGPRLPHGGSATGPPGPGAAVRARPRLGAAARRPARRGHGPELGRERRLPRHRARLCGSTCRRSTATTRRRR